MQGSKPPATIGPYQIFEPLGSGGMASVYRGTRYDEHGWVAVKLIHDSSLIDLSKPRWGLLHRLKRLIGKG